jgi:hypothetical protein
LADKLNEGPDIAFEDVRNFARRQPWAFLAAAGVLGFAAGRLVGAAAGGDGPPPSDEPSEPISAGNLGFESPAPPRASGRPAADLVESTP